MEPQSPSPALASHSFKLSLILMTAWAAASIAASRTRPCRFNFGGRSSNWPTEVVINEDKYYTSKYSNTKLNILIRKCIAKSNFIVKKMTNSCTY